MKSKAVLRMFQQELLVQIKNYLPIEANEAKEMLMNKLKAAGVDLSKVKIVAINSVVQGPKYKGDFKDTEKYGKFQYIKLKAF